MKVAFVNLGYTNALFQPPLNLCYLASYVRKYAKHKYEFIIIDETMGDNVEKKLKEFKPDIVGVTALTTTSQRAFDIAKFCKRINAVSIIGGIHATVCKDTILNESEFDIAVIGEGEQTFLEILEGEDLEDIDGIIFRRGSEIVHTPKRELIKDIDIIPIPARDLIDMEKYISKRDIHQKYRITNMITTRGCPYNCIYCSVNRIAGGFVRFNSVEHVKREIDDLKKYNVEAIYFSDDTFTMNMPRLTEICNYLKDNDIKFYCMGRANQVNEEMLTMLKNSGCVEIAFGFESMSPKILEHLKKGTVTVEQNRNAVKLCKKVGLPLQAFFMIGSPYETREDIKMTFDFADEEGLIPAFFITTPFIGTELYDWCKENNLIPDKVDWSKAFLDYRVSLSASNVLTKEEIREIFLGLLGKYYKKITTFELIKKFMLRPKFSIPLIKDYIKLKCE